MPRRLSLPCIIALAASVLVLGDYDSAQVDGAPPSKIAIVGAGIGGTATAHFLRQHFGPEVRIDVFENGTVGGRLATVTVNHQDYESGGSIIHSLNLHMQDFVKHLGLKHRRSVAGKTAVFNGKEFILEETDWYLLDLFRLWWRYGISFIRLQMWVEEIMEKFMRIYKYQAHGYAFSSVEELLHSLGGTGFLNMTRRSLSESLLELGVSQRFIDEVIAPIMRVNYGQNISIPAFVGAVSLAGAQANLWAVEGGNKLVCSGLLKLAKANLIQAQVTAISPHTAGESSLYQVNYDTPTETGTELYDIVVVATPLQDGVGPGIFFEGFEPPLPEITGSYHVTVASIVHGYLNCSYFGFPDPKLFPFASVLTTDTPGLFFNSAASICPVNISAGFRRKQPQEAGIYKVFSQKPLGKEELKTLFKSYYSVQVRDWQAYPHYGSTQGLPPVILHENLYYLNGMEWAGSAMEMSSVAAKNIALLAYHRWNRQLEMIDQKDLMHKIKAEL
ncbi:prenylcysteine oxidase 1-like [Paramormyrops kingsleyae]|uniref:Prenylcysteine oxidase 1 like n=2 Tax=Paramormyrops kingsleyae TaxID=1676925 RepID=A0A3B3QRM6_9TELE|nr:prenylcysteine oxidase-like [Paramormyrops kingsleyae]XP_023654471.1 prenylcysteine oxidase-like [Paramormyrops kingsleyae]